MEEEKETTRKERADEEPQVFAVKRDLNGWRFSRRDFLAATGGAVAAAVAGTVAGCASGTGGQAAPTEAPTDTPAPTNTPTPPPTDTPTPTNTPTPTRTPRPTRTPTPTMTPTPTPPEAQFVADVTIPDGTIMSPGQAFTKTWHVKNSGVVPWGEETQLVFASGTQMTDVSLVAVGDAEPDDTVDISVDMVAPTEAGSYTGWWSLNAADGTAMATLTVNIAVGSSEPLAYNEDEVKIEVTVGGETRTFYLPCGSPIPPGAVCVCNCVAIPAPCSCDGVCACVGHTTCSCDEVCTCDTVHYWYPC